MSQKATKLLHLKIMLFVHKMTSRLARPLKIGTDKVVCTRNPKITFKTSKNQPFFELLYQFA